MKKHLTNKTRIYYNMCVSSQGAVAVHHPPYCGAIASIFTKLSHTFHKTITIG